jgi:hypothetical protein
MPSNARQLSAMRSLLMVLTLALVACEQRDAESRAPATAPAAEAPAPVLWQRVKDATVVAVNDADIQAELAQAMAKARRSAADARQRWTLAKPEERALWAVKWAAPLAASATAGAPSSEEVGTGAREAQATTTPDAPQPPNADADADAAEPAEHVWVQPINWSPFRIEGVLLSEPVHALDSGRTTGEIVSFPIDELSDWIHFAADPATNPDAPFEGGYTVTVLEEEYGRP